MSDSTPTLDQLSTSSANIPTRLNESNDALSPSSLYGRRASTTTGLIWGYYGGRFASAPIANGTVTLTASTTNYVVAAVSGGAVSVSPAATNWNDPANYIRLYKIVGGASTVTSYEDHRQAIGAAGSGGGAVTSVAGKTGAVTLTPADVGLSNVDNTSDVNKPVSTAQAAAISASKSGFSANKNGVAQSIAADTITKVTFGTEVFDTGNEYDVSISRWTPKTGGLKLITAAIFTTAAVTGQAIQVRLYKNGVQVANGGIASSNAVTGISAAFIQQANGTTDYFEIYTYFSSAGNAEGAIGTTAFSGYNL